MSEPTVTITLSIRECRAVVNCASMIADALITEAQNLALYGDTDGVRPLESGLMRMETALVLEGAER